MKSFPCTLQIVETAGGPRLQCDSETFNALYAATGKRSKKARHKRKQVKKLIIKALRRLAEEYEKENQKDL